MNQFEFQSKYSKIHLNLPNIELLQKEIADRLKISLEGVKKFQADCANNPIFQSAKQQELKQSLSQISSKEVITEEKRHKSTARIGKLQVEILFLIAEEEKENKPVLWSPSKLSGASKMTPSNRAAWTKAFKNLEKRGLVERINTLQNDTDKLSVNKNKFKKTYVCLTQLGREAIVVANKNL